MEEKERRPIPTLQTSRDGHSNSLSILLNTTCNAPSAGPTAAVLRTFSIQSKFKSEGFQSVLHTQDYRTNQS